MLLGKKTASEDICHCWYFHGIQLSRFHNLYVLPVHLRTYNENEVHTNTPKQQMRDLLLLCTKNVHFSYNGDM